MDIQQWSRSHAPRGNAPIDAPRRVRNLSLEIITTNRDAERQDSRSHAERGNEFVGYRSKVFFIAMPFPVASHTRKRACQQPQRLFL